MGSCSQERTGEPRDPSARLARVLGNLAVSTGTILLHIGYHKTGGGWLRRHFYVDPGTGFRSVGKTGIDHPVRRLVSARPFEFDAAIARAAFDPLVERVSSEGLVPVVSFERLTGHPFSGGYDGKEIADRLAATFPDGRVLVVIREQRSMILSTYSQYVREGGSWALEQFMNPPVTKSLRVPWFDFRHFEYHHLIAYYRRLFGEDRVLTLAFEQFRADPAAFVSAIARFGGRTLSGSLLRSLPLTKLSNPSPSPLAVELRRRLNRLGWPADLNPNPVFTNKIVQTPFVWVASALSHSQIGPGGLNARKRADLHRLVTDVVGERYAGSNRITAELTGIDLTSYGWTL
jgi:hypothetical protein